MHFANLRAFSAFSIFFASLVFGQWDFRNYCGNFGDLGLKTAKIIQKLPKIPKNWSKCF